MRRSIAGMSLVGGTLAFGTTEAAQAQESGNIVEVAVAAGSLNTLGVAVKAADLVKTLPDGTPYTVFAPTAEASHRSPRPI